MSNINYNANNHRHTGRWWDWPKINFKDIEWIPNLWSSTKYCIASKESSQLFSAWATVTASFTVLIDFNTNDDDMKNIQWIEITEAGFYFCSTNVNFQISTSFTTWWIVFWISAIDIAQQDFNWSPSWLSSYYFSASWLMYLDVWDIVRTRWRFDSVNNYLTSIRMSVFKVL